MKFLPITLGIACSALAAQARAQIAGDAAVQAQWFTGSLEAPSPALPEAGLVALEPYLINQDNSGAYDGHGNHHSVANDTDQLQSLEVFKYGITDRLTLEALPPVSHVWNGQSNATGLGDLPLELEYRFNDENNRTGFPSFTASAGVTLPTGSYNHLRSSLDALGTGAYTLKQGLLAQSLFDSWGDHPVRLRFYGEAFEPVANVSLRGISAYGTPEGFHGHALPGFSGVVGAGAGWGINQRWVLAFDVVQNVANGAQTRGSISGLADNSNAPATSSTAIAPAVEYNWSDSVGVIAGIAITVAGRNSVSYFAPQIALAMSF